MGRALRTRTERAPRVRQAIGGTAPDMWLFLGIAGLLTAVLSGLPSPAPSGQHKNGTIPNMTLDLEERLGIRLVNGSSRCSGSVKVLLESWEPVCAAHWNRAATEAVCKALNCGDSGKVTYLMPPTSELPPGATSGNTSSAGNTTWARAPTERCRGANWQFCKVQDQECSSDRRLVWVTCAENQAVPVSVKDKDSQGLTLLILCIVLGILLLVSTIFIVILLLRAKGQYALPASVNHQQLSTANQAGINNYHPVPITIAKEAPMLFIQPRVPADSDSSSDSDYEHYDFSSQPPVALTTFYNSQRHRVTEEEAQQNRFQMPPLEEGLEELHVSHIPAADPRPCVADVPSRGSQYHVRNNSDSSTSSEEGYCNDPSSKPPPWNSQAFYSEKSPLTEQPPNLELAGSPAVFSGPSAEDSSSTSSGEWYQNFQPPPQHPPAEQFECPGPPGPQTDSIDDDEEDYDDIGAA